MLEHARLGQNRGMTAVPDHVAVRFVGKDHELGSAHNVGDRGQVVARCHATSRVVRRIEQDRPRPGIGREKMPDIVGRWPKLIFDLQGRKHGPRTAPLQVRHIGRKLGSEDQNAIARVKHRLGEKLLEGLGTRADHDVFRRDGIAEFGRDKTRPRRAEFGQPEARTVTGVVFLDRLDARPSSRAACWETDCRRSRARRHPFPSALSARAIASTVNADSAERFASESLSLGIVCVRGRMGIGHVCGRRRMTAESRARARQTRSCIASTRPTADY